MNRGWSAQNLQALANELREVADHYAYPEGNVAKLREASEIVQWLCWEMSRAASGVAREAHNARQRIAYAKIKAAK